MQRAFIRINSTNHTDMLFNPDRVTFVEEKNEGCIIHFSQGSAIKTDARFEVVVDAIERAVQSNEN